MMKKTIISSVVAVLFGVFCFNSNSYAYFVDKTYTATVNSNGKVIAVTEEKTVAETKKLHFVLRGDLPEDASNIEIIQKLILDEDPEYLVQEKHKIGGIVSWDFRQGDSYRITYEEGIVVSEKMDAVTDSGLSNQIKKEFYGNIVLVLLFGTIVVAGGALYAVNYKRVSLALLLLAFVLVGGLVSINYPPKSDLLMILMISTYVTTVPLIIPQRCLF